MKILLIGGTGFVGPHLARMLIASGHDLRVFSRGEQAHRLPPAVKRINADLTSLNVYRKVLRPMAFDVVVHMIASTADDAQAVVDAFSNYAGRIVAASSFDVYRAFGALLHNEAAPPHAAAPILDESAPLRTSRNIYGDLREKLDVEQAFSLDAERLPATILRLPYLYGPDDPRQRLFPWVKRFDDQRPAILLEPSYGTFRITHAYVENVAHAFYLAITSPQPSDQPVRLYNVGEVKTPTVGERVHDLARAAGYKGTIIVVPRDRCPPHLIKPVDLRHNVVLNDSAIRRELGYSEIVPTAEALQRTISWQRTVCPVDIDLSEFDYAAEDLFLRQFGLAS